MDAAARRGSGSGAPGAPGVRTGLATTGLATLAVLLALTGPACAHVTVHPGRVRAGSSDVELTFRVPNERDDADTVKTQVFLPANLPLLTVDVLPIPGWQAKVQTRTLPKPVSTDDGTVSQVVSDVTWSATAGGIRPGQYQDFDIAVGSMPDQTGTLVFKALQTYSSGEIVRWIEVPVAGEPAPDAPAPEMTLTPAASAAAAPTSSAGDSGIAIAALVIAAVALAGVLLLAERSRRSAPRG
jgi:uncharacterized protein YcnI